MRVIVIVLLCGALRMFKDCLQPLAHRRSDRRQKSATASCWLLSRHEKRPLTQRRAKCRRLKFAQSERLAFILPSGFHHTILSTTVSYGEHDSSGETA